MTSRGFELSEADSLENVQVRSLEPPIARIVQARTSTIAALCILTRHRSAWRDLYPDALGEVRHDRAYAIVPRPNALLGRS